MSHQDPKASLWHSFPQLFLVFILSAFATFSYAKSIKITHPTHATHRPTNSPSNTIDSITNLSNLAPNLNPNSPKPTSDTAPVKQPENISFIPETTNSPEITNNLEDISSPEITKNPKITSLFVQNPTPKDQTIVQTTAKTPSPPQNISLLPTKITITNRTITVFPVNSTLTDSGDSVALYNQKFLYGHNTQNVFKDLKHLQIGDTFTLSTTNGNTNYQISHITLLSKQRTADFMGGIITASFQGQTYDFSLMTCAGDPRPNRDATHRLILFANRI